MPALKARRRKGWLSRPWVAARQTIQVLALLAFLALFVLSRRGGWPPSLVNLPMRLDPLAMLAHLLASRSFLAGSAVALLTILLTLVFGRAWCGWLCPLGTILDLFSLDRWRGKRPGPPESWRNAKYALLLIILSAALFANLTLLVFDPLTLLLRTLTMSIWPAVDRIFSAAEAFIFQIPWLPPAAGDGLARLDSLVRPALLPIDPAYYRDALLYAGVFIGVILLNLLAPRFWCRYLCPLGGFLGLLSRAALFRRQVGDECKACVLCGKACPTGTIRAEKGYASDPAECTICMECQEACPRSGISFLPRVSLAEGQSYDPGRRHVLLALGTAIAGVSVFRSDLLAKRDNLRLIRPPGARENNLLSKCLRCGECMRACPTSALQPAISEAGLEGMWTPVLILRLGYCDYSCNACGQVCPVQAIPPLSLDDKRTKVIGWAYIDQNRCIAWADHRDCIVCEEMCPVPNKAIKLERTEVKNADGETVSVQLPKVNRDRCIGCGICEYKCPVNGEAAIRVSVPGLSTEG